MQQVANGVDTSELYQVSGMHVESNALSGLAHGTASGV
jgi:hypothetical protein